ncbi:MAG: hypothetical protein Q4G08_00455 [Capnocytophaga sp.]|nr:hypothetical protein [Capnocytophaga sp.]
MKEQLEKELLSLAENIVASKGQWDLTELKQQANKLNEKITILNFVQKYYQHLGASENHIKVSMSKTSRFITDELLPSQPKPEEEEVVISEEKSVVETPHHHPWEHFDATEAENIQEEITEPARNTVEEPTEEPIIETEKPAEVVTFADLRAEPVAEPEPLQEQPTLQDEPQIVSEPEDSPSAEPAPAKEPAFSLPQFDTPYAVGEPVVEEQPTNDTVEWVIKPEEEATKASQHLTDSLDQILAQTPSHPGFEIKTEEEAKPLSINDALGKSSQIGLNDRLAFIKNLFIGSESEYNRVVEKLNGFGTAAEAVIYLEQEVKPIYNNWKGKEEYQDRFMQYVVNRYEA